MAEESFRTIVVSKPKAEGKMGHKKEIIFLNLFLVSLLSFLLLCSLYCTLLHYRKTNIL